jgi:hypothetical protein
VDRLSAKERERIAELLAEGAPFWRLCEEVGRSRHAIRRAVMALSRPAPTERAPPERPSRANATWGEPGRQGSKKKAGPRSTFAVFRDLIRV